MTTIYDVHAYKGGVGVTTTACALALHFCEKGNKTLLLSRDKHADALSWLGCSGNDGVTAIKQGLDHALSTTDVNIDNYEIVVLDNGQEPLATYFTNVVNVVVVRNDYISLKNTLNKEHDILVAFVADTNTLSAQGVAYTLGSTPVVAKIDPSVARAIDAGLAISRNHLFPWTEKIAGFVPGLGAGAKVGSTHKEGRNMSKQYDQIRELLDRAWAIANDRQSDHEISDDRNRNYQLLDELLVAINFASDRLDNAREAFARQPHEAR